MLQPLCLFTTGTALLVVASITQVRETAASGASIRKLPFGTRRGGSSAP